jgi:hypothetical protein
MSKLQRRPEPLARKLSMLNCTWQSRGTQQFFARINFAASGTKILGSLGKLVLGRLLLCAGLLEPLRRPTL